MIPARIDSSFWSILRVALLRARMRDQLIMTTPKSIDLRMKLLDENDRKRADRAKEAETV